MRCPPDRCGRLGRTLAWLALAQLLAACATAEPRPAGPEIHSLRIDGARQLDEAQIKKKILTSQSGGWPFGSPAYFDPNAWQADLRRIERYYQAQGYYQAKIVDEHVRPRGTGQVDVEVRVREGLPTVIGAISIRGLEGLPQDDQLVALEELPLAVGQVFHEEDWALVKQRITANLRERGYAEATVSGEVAVETVTAKARVELEVKPGLRYRFGNIFVVTDPHPQVGPKRIIEMAQGAITPGDWYGEKPLAEAQARVFKMGVFGGVKVNRGAPDRAARTVPVIVDVREAPFHTLRMGGGLGVDQTRNEARASAEYTDRNFLGGLRRLTLHGRLGYAFLPNVVAVLANNHAAEPQQGLVFNAGVQLEQPSFFARDLKLQASVGAESGIEQAYRYIGGRTKLGVIWQPHPDFSIFPSYNLEAYRLQGTALPGGTAPQLVLGCAEGVTCTLSYLEQVIEWDRRKDSQGRPAPIEPKRGYYVGLALQEGGGPLQGSFSYLRVIPDLRYYQSFLPGDRFTVAAKLRLGSLISFSGQSPIVSRFFSGGSFMRGFGARRLSPMVLVGPQPPTQQLPDPVIGVQEAQVVPVGGNGLFEGSLELRYAITEKLVLATFVDLGFVTVDSFGKVDGRYSGGYIPDNLLYAVGIGARYLTVVGPVRVDLGYRLPFGPPLSLTRLNGQTLIIPELGGCFGLFQSKNLQFGGAPESVCNLQISIGEAF